MKQSAASWFLGNIFVPYLGVLGDEGLHQRFGAQGARSKPGLQRHIEVAAAPPGRAQGIDFGMCGRICMLHPSIVPGRDGSFRSGQAGADRHATFGSAGARSLQCRLVACLVNHFPGQRVVLSLYVLGAASRVPEAAPSRIFYSSRFAASRGLPWSGFWFGKSSRPAAGLLATCCSLLLARVLGAAELLDECTLGQVHLQSQRNPGDDPGPEAGVAQGEVNRGAGERSARP